MRLGARLNARPSLNGDVFAGNPDPQPTIGLVARRGLFTPTLSGTPGLRVARSRAPYTGVTRYTGTELTPQQFVKQPAGVNSEEALAATVHAPIKRNRQRALGQMRGLPAMALPEDA